MSNRTDYTELTKELYIIFEHAFMHTPRNKLAAKAIEIHERIETELHNAHVAGSEGSDCGCRQCRDKALGDAHAALRDRA